MEVPVIALRGLTVLPGMVVHFDASRKMSIEAAQKAMASGQKVFLTMQKDITVENPGFEDLHAMGTLARVKQLIKMQGNVLRIMVEGLERVELMSLNTEGTYLTGEIEFRPMGAINKELDYSQQEAMLRILKEDLEKYGADSSLGKQAIPHLLECRTLADLIQQVLITFPFSVESRQEILEISGYEELYMFILNLIREETVINQIKKEFQAKVKEHIDKSQKEYILREQMKVIREELGEDISNVNDADEYAKRAEKLKAPKEVKETLKKEISRFRMIPNGSQEGTVSRNYIEALLELPWNKVSRDNNDTIRARQILDEDHYGMEDIKKRVIEYLAVRAVTKKGDAPIICLAGPPGTGKTSIARSVARALNKKYVRVCLGGVRDEAEIRGHRRTYIGASPYHAFPASLGLEISVGGDDTVALEAIAEKLVEKNAVGRFSTWPSPVNMALVDVAVEYAIDWINGEITERADFAACEALFNEACAGATLAKYTNADGTTIDNYFTVLLTPVDFNDYVK